MLAGDVTQASDPAAVPTMEGAAKVHLVSEAVPATTGIGPVPYPQLGMAGPWLSPAYPVFPLNPIHPLSMTGTENPYTQYRFPGTTITPFGVVNPQRVATIHTTSPFHINPNYLLQAPAMTIPSGTLSTAPPTQVDDRDAGQKGPVPKPDDTMIAHQLQEVGTTKGKPLVQLLTEAEKHKWREGTSFNQWERQIHALWTVLSADVDPSHLELFQIQFWKRVLPEYIARNLMTSSDVERELNSFKLARAEDTTTEFLEVTRDIAKLNYHEKTVAALAYRVKCDMNYLMAHQQPLPSLLEIWSVLLSRLPQDVRRAVTQTTCNTPPTHPLAFLTLLDWLVITFTRAPVLQRETPRPQTMYNNKAENTPMRTKTPPPSKPSKPNKSEASGHKQKPRHVGNNEPTREAFVGAVSNYPRKVFVDTMASVPVIGSDLAAHAVTVTGQSSPIKLPFVSHPIRAPKGKVSVTPVEVHPTENIEITGYLDRTRLSKTLIRPDQLDTVKCEAIIHGTKVPVRNNAGEWYFLATPDTISSQDNQKYWEVLSSKFGLVCTGTETSQFQLVLSVHQILGCPGINCFSATLRSLGIGVPRRLVESAVTSCEVCVGLKDRPPLKNDDDLDLLVGAVTTCNESFWTLHVDTGFFTGETYDDTSGFLGGVITPINFYVAAPIITRDESQAIIDGWLKRFPRIKRLRSDQAREFWNPSVHHEVAPDDAKDANGCAENAIKQLKTQIQLATRQLHSVLSHLSPPPDRAIPTYWPLLVGVAAYRLNIRAQARTGLIAFEQVFSVQPDYTCFPLRIVGVQTQPNKKRKVINPETEQGIVLAQHEPHKIEILLWDNADSTIKEFHRTNLVLSPIKFVGALSTMRAVKGNVPLSVALPSRQEAFEKLVDLGCFTREAPPGQSVSLLFVTTRTGEVVKSRVTLRGDTIRNPTTDVTTHLPDLWLRLLSLVHFLSKGLNIAAVDVEKAYYQTPYSGEISLKLPRYLKTYKGFHGGQTVGLARVIPGLPEGAKLWCTHFKKILTEKLEWKEIVPGFFRKGMDDLVQYMDDLLLSVKNPKETWDDINEHINLDELVLGPPQKYVGLTFLAREDTITVTMDAYFESLPPIDDGRPLTPRDCKQLSRLEPDTNDPVSLAEAQHLVGVLGWASQIYLSLKPVFTLASTRARSNPTQVINFCKKAIRWAMRTRDGLRFQPVRGDKLILRVWVDAAYDLKDLEATAAVTMQVVDESFPISSRSNTVFARAIRVKKLVRSTFAAELEACVLGLAALHRIVDPLQRIMGRVPLCQLFTDSRPVYLALKSGETTCDFSRSLLKFTSQEIARLSVSVMWITTDQQQADALTKFKATPFTDDIESPDASPQ